jgi:predicted RNase H-like HicB family nuclease
MAVKIIVHQAEEGGFWAEVPVLPGCASQGETMEDLITNIREAIAGCVATDMPRDMDDGARRAPTLVEARPRAGWARASQAIAESGDDAMVWPEFPNADHANRSW